MPYLEITPILILIRFIETFGHVYLLNSILKKKLSVAKYLLSTIIIVSLYEIFSFFIPYNIKFVMLYILVVLVMTWTLKIHIYKVILGYALTMLIISLLDMLCVVIVVALLGMDHLQTIANSNYSYITMIILNLLVFIAAFAIKYFKMSFANAENNIKDLGIAFNSLLTLLFVLPSSIVIIYYTEGIPLSLSVIIVNLITMFAILVLSIFNSQKRYNLLLSQQEVECQKSYITILQSLVDNLRAFKHDYNNTLSAISGCVQLEDIEALKRVLNGVLEESKKISTLDRLNPDTIKNPTIYGLMTSKYQKCEKNNVNMNLEIFSDLENMEIKTFDLTRILGIFLDNAIEAASGSKSKKVNIYISERKNKVTIEISNTFSDKELAVDKMFEKGVSSKGENRGLGLYKVKEIIKRYSTVTLNTCVHDDMFLQKLTIQKAV